MSAIALRGVSHRRGGRLALSGVDLAVERGELVALVGPSGSGKSTLLEILSGLETPSEGRVEIDGRDVTTAEPKARGVALVFQTYALYPHMDVAANIGFPLSVERRPRAEIDARVRETAARLSIDHLLARRPRELSGGERQRVALARAIVRRPPICLFDEPLSNLDPALRTRMRAEIKELHRELGATFVWVTHDQAEAMTLADRVVVLRDGTVRQVGPPREIYARPREVFVAGFFGSPAINLLPGAPHGRPDAATIGIRPEDVDAGVGPPPPDAGNGLVTVTGRVRLVEPMGAETWLTLAASRPDGAIEITGRAQRDFPGDADGPGSARTGAPCWARFDPRRALAFDATGAALDGRSIP